MGVGFICRDRSEIRLISYIFDCNQFWFLFQIAKKKYKVGFVLSNVKLLKFSAKAVSIYLIKKGIATERIDVKFDSDAKRASSNDTDEGRRMD